MWVSTSFSVALNFLPHQVRSAFQLSIRPPSSRMKRKFPCSAQGGTSSGLARYSLVAGSKDWAEQSRREAATKPVSPIFFAIGTRCAVSCLPRFKPSSSSLLLSSFSPPGGKEQESKACSQRAELSRRKTSGDYRGHFRGSAAKDALGATHTD